MTLILIPRLPSTKSMTRLATRTALALAEDQAHASASMKGTVGTTQMMKTLELNRLEQVRLIIEIGIILLCIRMLFMN